MPSEIQELDDKPTPTANSFRLMFKTYIWKILKAALPNFLVQVGGMLQDTISFFFIGSLGDPIFLSALGFSITWGIALGRGIMFGLASGFGGLASQAYGAKNYAKLSLMYQKILVIQIISFVCLSAILVFTEPILITFGYDSKLAELVGLVTKVSIPSLLAYGIYETTIYYLIAQNHFQIGSYFLVLGLILHVSCCYLFISKFQMGIIGIALTRDVSLITITIGLYLYLRLYKPTSSTWLPWTKECLNGLWEYFSEIFRHGSCVYLEWMQLEVSNLVMGFTRNFTVVGAHTSGLNFVYMTFMPILGVTIATTTYVGNCAGEGNKEKAKAYGISGLVINFSLASIFVLLLLFKAGWIATLYTEDKDVEEYFVVIMGIFALGLHAFSGENLIAYLLRVLNQKDFVLLNNITSFYVVGLTLQVFLTYYLEWGYKGVWIGLISGFYTNFILGLIKLCKMNLKKQIEKIHHSMKGPSIMNNTEDSEDRKSVV